MIIKYFQILYRNRFYISTHTPRFKNTSKELLVKFKTFQQIFNKSLARLLFVKLVVSRIVICFIIDCQ